MKIIPTLGATALAAVALAVPASGPAASHRIERLTHRSQVVQLKCSAARDPNIRSVVVVLCHGHDRTMVVQVLGCGVDISKRPMPVNCREVVEQRSSGSAHR